MLVLDASNLPEIIFSSSDAQLSKQISELLSKGLIRKILARVYTANLIDEPESILQRNLFFILGHLYPKAVLSYRSALELRPTAKGNLYLTYSYSRNIEMLHLQLRFVKGSEPLPSDNPLTGELYLSSLERACLENLKPSRKGRDGEKRVVDKAVIEKRLLDILTIDGEAGINTFRDKAKEVAQALGFEKEFEKLNLIIGALLATKSIKGLKSPLAIARALGEPYDALRVDIFWQLFSYLKSNRFEKRKLTVESGEAFQNFAFFEAYFSNFIEGTEFEIEEAKEIVFQNVVIENRTGDTHDIKGTFEIVSNPFEMRKIPTQFEQFLELLKNRHRIIMRGRQDKRPGQFKAKANRAGNTVFVAPGQVRGTLKKGFELYQALEQPFSRAVFIMFLITEIHPFEDGNGRVARVMMNAELVKAGYSKILIPTVFREDYLLALRKLSRKKIRQHMFE